MNKMKPKTFTKAKKFLCDWSDEKNYLAHYKMLKLFVRHGMIVDKVHEIIRFKQSKWLENYIDFNTQIRNKTKNDFEKDFYKLFNNAFCGKAMDNVGNRLRSEFIKKYEYKKIVNQQSELTFAGNHKSYENCDSYLFKKNEVKMDKTICLGFAKLEISKLHMNERYYDKLQPYFGQENDQIHYIDTDVFVLSMNTKHIIKDLKKLEDIFVFSNLDENHELFSIKNKSSW